MLHDVPLDPLLRPRLTQCRPLPTFGLPSSEEGSKYSAGPALAVFCARRPTIFSSFHPRCSEGLQPAPSRRSNVRAVASNAAVAAFATMRLRVRPLAVRQTRPLMVTVKKETQTCWLLWLLWLRLLLVT